MSTETPLDLAALGEDFTRNPHPVYAALRERGPVHRVRTPEGPLAWLVVGHEAARAVLADDRHFSKRWDLASPEAGFNAVAPGPHMLTSDPPDHTRLRKLVAREFTARRVKALAPRVLELTDALLDTMLTRPGGRADLVADLALPLPISVICELLGVPDLERDRFCEWSDRVLGTAPPAVKAETARALTAYLEGLLDRRREEPGDDLLSALVRTADAADEAEDGDAHGDGGAHGDRLSSAELTGMAWLLLIAGYETTVGLIANGTLALLQHPEQLAALRSDPTLMDGAVEEMLRHQGPVEVSTYRFCVAPVEIGGTRIPGDGQLVLPVLADAGRDPDRFPAPDRFDIRRRTRGHLAFGHGIHFCLGAPLARMEAGIVLGRLLERAPRLALDADPATLDWRDGLLLRGLLRLPVRFG